MSEQEKILVVVDPNQDTHVALERAIITAGLRDVAPKLYVFVGIDVEAVDTRAGNDNLFRDQAWFDEVIRQPIEAKGLDYEIDVSWSTDWQESILQAARSFSIDTILIPVHAKTNKRRFTFSESKWALLKTASCPVILVRPSAHEQRKIILAAVNFQASKDEQRALNQAILERGKLSADRYGAEFHVVNAYIDSMNYPDRGKLATETGLAADHIHVKPGYTDEVVAAVADEIGADMVVVGTVGQTGKKATRRGNTVARVIGGLDVDVMVFNTVL